MFTVLVRSLINSPASHCRNSHYTDSNTLINCKRIIYKFTQYTVNTINNNSLYLTNECRHAPKRHATTVCFVPGPALGLGSSLLTLTVAVALALGTSPPRPERTPLDRPPLAILRSPGLQSISHRLVVFQPDSYTTLSQTCVLFD